MNMMTVLTPPQFLRQDSPPSNALNQFCDGTINAATIKPQNIMHQYNFNTVRQAKRLFENSSRQTHNVVLSNFQDIGERRVPTCPKVVLNAGVYMSSVTPALQSFGKDWSASLSTAAVECIELSDRIELGGRTVGAKTVFLITENSDPSTKYKVVLHFYDKDHLCFHVENLLQNGLFKI